MRSYIKESTGDVVDKDDIAKLGQRYFESLKKHGTTEPFMEDMLNFSQLQHLLGTDDILARGKTYE